jgi:hypothetical protein
MSRASVKFALLSAILCLATGCATRAPVQAWEKGKLAKSEMLIQGDPLETGFDNHIYASREGASGGAAVGGGGCGCN